MLAWHFGPLILFPDVPVPSCSESEGHPGPSAPVDPELQTMLLFEVGGRVCALPVTNVDETLRPLPLETLPIQPAALLGISVVRGAPVPVIDLSAIFDIPAAKARRTEPAHTRWIIVASDRGHFALAVEAVRGVEALGANVLHTAPLLGEPNHEDPLEACAVGGTALFFLLSAARLVPENVWNEIQARRRDT